MESKFKLDALDTIVSPTFSEESSSAIVEIVGFFIILVAV